MSTPVEIAPAKGKLGILLVGLGAVSTTTIAGVFAIRKGLAKPIGSLAEMGTIRLGKRTEGRSPLIREFVPLATLNDIVFGGWDIFADNCYEAAKHAGVLEDKLLDQVKDELAAVKPMSAVFDRQYVKRLDGPNVKTGKNKKDLADQLIADIRKFKTETTAIALSSFGPAAPKYSRSKRRATHRSLHSRRDCSRAIRRLRPA